jgi:hypothetical protein
MWKYITLQMNIKKAIFIITMSIMSSSCVAQKELSSPDQIAASFFKSYQQQGFDAAIENVSLYTEAEMRSSMPSLRDTLSQIIDLVGKTFLGSEVLFKKDVSASLSYHSYIIKYPRAPLRLTFVFYKPSDKWRVINFSLDGDMTSEMQQLGRIYYLK